MNLRRLSSNLFTVGLIPGLDWRRARIASI